MYRTLCRTCACTCIMYLPLPAQARTDWCTAQLQQQSNRRDTFRYAGKLQLHIDGLGSLTKYTRVHENSHLLTSKLKTVSRLCKNTCR